MFDHTSSVPWVAVSPKRSWTRTKVISEGDGFVFPHDKFESGEPMVVGRFRILKEGFDRMDSQFDKMDRRLDKIYFRFEAIKQDMSKTNQCLRGLQLQVQQPRLAAKKD